MVWYHLSTGGNLEPAITEVRKPTMAHGESDTPRVSVAPTVVGCITALSLRKSLFVYEVSVRDPEPADDTVPDPHRTYEHWIKQGVLDRHNGSIPIKLLGKIDVDRNLLGDLKVALHPGKLKPGWEANERKLWSIKNGIWKPQFAGVSEIIDLVSSS